ncbi:MAG: long-chain-fatty-acid--CoA ligase [Candidatus Helarchaeota archaeon]
MSEDKPWYKYWPEDVPKTVEIPEEPLDKMLTDTAKKYPNLPAIYFLGKKYTFSWLNDQVNRFAKALQDLGLEKGDVVCIDFPNTPQFVISYYGIVRAGGIASPIVPLLKGAEIQHQIKTSEAKMLVIFDNFFDEYVKGILNNIPTIEHFILSGLGEYLSPIKAFLGKLLGKIPHMKKWPTGPKYHKFQDLLKKPGRPKPIEVDPKNDTAVMLFTGGTTGLPKGAEITHYNVVANVYQCEALLTKTQIGKEKIVGILPLSHAYGMILIMCISMKIAAEQILIPTGAADLPGIMKVIEKEKATLMPGVNALYNAINNHPKVKKFNLKSLTAGLSGAGPLIQEVQEEFEKLTGAKIVEGYGLTEATPVTHANPLYGRRKIGTVGFPIPNTDMKIVNIATGEEVGVGAEDKPYTHGELCIKGPQVMKGYYNRPDATAKTIVDGWLHTGDIAFLDDEGYTHIIDRMKDMIKYKGHSVYPREVEELLYEYEPIMEAGVIGIKDPSGEENIKAYVALKPEFKGKITAEDIKKWAKENISGFKYPREIEILDEVPKGTAGKVLRRKLREL